MHAPDIPVFNTKTEGVTEPFNLSDRDERKKYFAAKLGPEAAKIRKYLDEGKTFVAFLLGKKNSGKGTYTKLFMEAVGAEHVGHISIGDIVRDIHTALASPEEREKLLAFMKDNYRGFHDLDEIVAAIEGRTQSALISTELIIALLKYEISRRPRQALFIDGFPRGLDQVGLSLHLKDLLGYRSDPDFFVFLYVPETVIDERIKYRVICPICKTPRNTKLLATQEAGYDEATKSFYLVCDDPICNKARMVTKEGDELGIAPIRERLNTDDAIFNQLLGLQGVPKILLRNTVPTSEAAKVDAYEITPGYEYERAEDGTVKVIEKPWTIKDDAGVDSYSLLPAAVVVGMIRQIAKVLDL